MPAPSLGLARPSGPGQQGMGRGPVRGALLEVEDPRARVLTQGRLALANANQGPLENWGGGKGSASEDPLPSHTAHSVTCPPQDRSSPLLPSLEAPVNVTSST